MGAGASMAVAQKEMEKPTDCSDLDGCDTAAAIDELVRIRALLHSTSKANSSPSPAVLCTEDLMTPRTVADVAKEDRAFVEQTGISARISAALQKALFLSPRPATPEAFDKAFSDAFSSTESQQGAGGVTTQDGGESKDAATPETMLSVIVDAEVRKVRGGDPFAQ